MYKFRLAESRDLESLLRMSRDFFVAHQDSVEIPFDDDSTYLTLLSMIDDGLLVVAYSSDSEEALPPEEDQSDIHAMIGFSYFQSPINMHIKCARETMFWIDPEHRNGMLARTLMTVAQIGLKADDVQFTYMTALRTSPDAATKLYGAMGYVQVETSFIKEL